MQLIFPRFGAAANVGTAANDGAARSDAHEAQHCLRCCWRAVNVVASSKFVGRHPLGVVSVAGGGGRREMEGQQRISITIIADKSPWRTVDTAEMVACYGVILQ